MTGGPPLSGHGRTCLLVHAVDCLGLSFLGAFGRVDGYTGPTGGSGEAFKVFESCLFRN